jgi:hypothetical protein
MSLLSRDKKLNDIVKGKSVCLVGLSGYLVESNLGEFIDSHDIVCRIGDFPPFEFIKDYGIKLDVLFHAFSDVPHEIEEFRLFVNGNYNFYDRIRLMVAPTITQKPFGPFDKKANEIYNVYVDGFDKKPFTQLTEYDYIKVWKELNGDFNTGMVVMLMLLACEIKSLFITGFSFYFECDPKNYYPPKSCYWPGSVYTKYCNNALYENKKSGFVPGVILPENNHDQEHQKKYFVEKMLNFNGDKMVIDSYLKDIVLKIQYNNVKKIEIGK